jgi:hypothetical protein
MVNSELLKKRGMMPPITALNIPAMGGNPLAEAIPKHRGNAIKNTKNPAQASLNSVCFKVGFMVINLMTSLILLSFFNLFH